MGSVFNSLLVMLLALPTASGHRIRSGEHWAPRATVDTPGANGVVLFSGSVSGSRIGPAKINRAYRAVETRDRNAILRNIRIEGLRATALERDGIRLRGDVERVTIRDFSLRMRDRPQVRPHLPEGIALLSGRNITIANGNVAGFRMVSRPGQYTNGDGIAAEWPVRNLQITNVEANDNSDAGFDLKSSQTRLDRLTASRNSRNYRFWGEASAGRLTSIDPRNAHVWVGKRGTVRIDHLVARSRNKVPLLRLEAGAKVEIGRCSLSVPPNTPVVAGGPAARLKLGPGCRKQ